MKYPNGDTYSGSFEKGLRSGAGEYKFADHSSIVRGTWQKGVLAQAHWVLRDGTVIEGHKFSKDNQPNGEIQITYPSGFVGSGVYTKGKLQTTL
jgi:hypothetical protein